MCLRHESRRLRCTPVTEQSQLSVVTAVFPLVFDRHAIWHPPAAWLDAWPAHLCYVTATMQAADDVSLGSGCKILYCQLQSEYSLFSASSKGAEVCFSSEFVKLHRFDNQMPCSIRCIHTKTCHHVGLTILHTLTETEVKPMVLERWFSDVSLSSIFVVV